MLDALGRIPVARCSRLLADVVGKQPDNPKSYMAAAIRRALDEAGGHRATGRPLRGSVARSVPRQPAGPPDAPARRAHRSGQHQE
eukprot:1154871-Alexandrium_andersonii.AAC.1